ncbi:MAG: YbcC family protein [Kofleriaceae bacterium]
MAAGVPMNAADMKEVAERACARIAPTWPLDRFIAVNPFWPLTHKPLPEVAAELGSLSGARLLMPRQWYAQEWRAGRLRSEHLRAAIAERGISDVTEDDLVALFWSGEPSPARRPLVVDTIEAILRREHELTWRDFVMERVSRFCASYFDAGQAQISAVREGGFYASWRAQAKTDQAPQLFMGLRDYRVSVAKLPELADEMIARGCADLGVPVEERERYLSALLLDVNGWASWCAYLRWTARMAGEGDSHIRELLAIRLGWEWLLYSSSDETVRAEWRLAMTSWPAIDRAARAVRSDDWILQRAVEIAWESQWLTKVVPGFAAKRPATPKLQVAFCLDVRSEIYRRALEAQGEHIQTIGVAGFFGVPIEYAPLAADDARPQLPGLLAPTYRVTDTGAPEGLIRTRRARLDAAHAWKAFKSSSLSSFAFVDAVGLFFAGSLFRDAFRGERYRAMNRDRAGLTEAEDKSRMPRLTSRADGAPLTLDERCALASALLKTLGIVRNLGRLVLLVGHGSETNNNAHAAGLDCGACGGQPGDVNARAAAALLNDVEVRLGLQKRGIEVPATTLFIGALHNTTTDEVTMFIEGTTAAHQTDLVEARATLDRASTAARRERAPRLGLNDLTDEKLYAAVVKRATSWAEVRPEWGLAGNAAFIVAPRERSRHLDLGGRVFLHDYRADEDKDGAILEAIMAGPVVVAHWINFQYYMSTVDNPRYGCGNKVLHNIVGGHLGVFEGNSGDLRIGLSLQSLHDGERWVHTPLRLAVLIEAPRSAIDAVLAKHPKVRELADHEWIHLFQLDATERALFARRNSGWIRADG